MTEFQNGIFLLNPMAPRMTHPLSTFCDPAHECGIEIPGPHKNTFQDGWQKTSFWEAQETGDTE